MTKILSENIIPILKQKINRKLTRSDLADTGFGTARFGTNIKNSDGSPASWINIVGNKPGVYLISYTELNCFQRQPSQYGTLEIVYGFADDVLLKWYQANDYKPVRYTYGTKAGWVFGWRSFLVAENTPWETVVFSGAGQASAFTQYKLSSTGQQYYTGSLINGGAGLTLSDLSPHTDIVRVTGSVKLKERVSSQGYALSGVAPGTTIYARRALGINNGSVQNQGETSAKATSDNPAWVTFQSTGGSIGWYTFQYTAIRQSSATGDNRTWRYFYNMGSSGALDEAAGAIEAIAPDSGTLPGLYAQSTANKVEYFHIVAEVMWKP